MAGAPRKAIARAPAAIRALALFNGGVGATTGKIGRLMEEGADSVAAAEEASKRAFAMVLKKLYRANQMPAVMPVSARHIRTFMTGCSLPVQRQITRARYSQID